MKLTHSLGRASIIMFAIAIAGCITNPDKTQGPPMSAPTVASPEKIPIGNRDEQCRAEGRDPGCVLTGVRVDGSSLYDSSFYLPPMTIIIGETGQADVQARLGSPAISAKEVSTIKTRGTSCDSLLPCEVWTYNADNPDLQRIPINVGFLKDHGEGTAWIRITFRKSVVVDVEKRLAPWKAHGNQPASNSQPVREKQGYGNQTVSDSQRMQEKRQNLPKGFQGDSITDLIKQFESIADASTDEFTKTSTRNAKVAALRARTYRFVISPETNKVFGKDNVLIPGAKYDADAEMLKVNLWVAQTWFALNQVSVPLKMYSTIVLAANAKKSSYGGQNSYGAKATIQSNFHSLFGIAIANVQQKGNFALISLSIPMSPSEAKMTKSDLFFYVDAELTTSDALKVYVLRSVIGHEATISDPTELLIESKYLLANIKEIGVFKRSTGEVLGWTKSQ